MRPFDFILAVLAVWRVTHLLVAEDGPSDSVVRLRRAAGVGFWGKLLDCFYCLSLWVTIPFAIWLRRSWPDAVLLWLALSAAAILVNRVVERIAPDAPLYFEAPESEATTHSKRETV